MKRIPELILIFLIAVVCSSAQSLSKIEAELLGHLQKLEKASNYGSHADYDVLGKENEALRSALFKYGSRSDVLKYPFSKLSKKLFLTTSKDGKFRTYSWDTEEGGTMHDYLTVFQYRGKSGRAYAWVKKESDDDEDSGGGPFYHQIFQTDTPSGTIYLGVSTFIGSTSLAGQTISAFRINGEQLDPEAQVIQTGSGATNSISFSYDFFSVVDHPERPIRLFNYDEAKKSFRFPVVIEDSKTPSGRVTKKFITYRFDGKYFVKAN